MQQAADPTIAGHPTIELVLPGGSTLITVCCECGRIRSILFLDKDRWFCTGCRAEGATTPNLFPIA